MNVRIVFGLLFLIALFAWALVFAVLTSTDNGDTDGAKYFGYATFGVAPLALALGVYLLWTGVQNN